MTSTAPVLSCIRPQEVPAGEQVVLYCDGACDTQAGHGGWACILSYGGKELELSGHERDTTNNRMELSGLLQGLKALKRPCVVMVVTDSQYLRNAFTQKWILNWQKNGWKTASKEPVKNQDLWEELIALAQKHDLRFVWVKGHSGHEFNERVDRLAVQERLKLRTP